MKKSVVIKLWAIPYALIVGVSVNYKIWPTAAALSFYGLMMAIAEVAATTETKG